MKKVLLLAAVAVLTVSAVPLRAAAKDFDHGKGKWDRDHGDRWDRDDRDHRGDRDDRGHYGFQDTSRTPTNVPEPGSFAMLASGLLALGGLALVTRKKLSNNQIGA